MLNNIDDTNIKILNCKILESSFGINSDSSSDENSINIEFESISQSFLKKYIRYSDRLKDLNNKENYIFFVLDGALNGVLLSS